MNFKKLTREIHKTDKKTWYHLNYDIWFTSEPVRNLQRHIKSMTSANKKYLMKSHHDGMTIDKLTQSYLNSVKPCTSYEKINPENRKNEPRYGEAIILYLGRNISFNHQILLTKEFISQICYGEQNLPYYVTTSRNKNEVYVHIWICDREIVKNEPKTYNKTQYVRADGKLCGVNDPLVDRVLYSKGEIQKDANGNVKLNNGWRQKKTRIFTESYATMWPRLRDSILAIYYKIMKRINVQLKFSVKDEFSEKRKEFVSVNRGAPDWKNVKYREIASLQYFIKYVIHELMTESIEPFDPRYDESPGYIDFKEPRNYRSRQLYDLFKEYDEIFDCWEFRDELLHLRPLMFTGFKEVMYNLRALRTRFKNQIDLIMVG